MWRLAQEISVNPNLGNSPGKVHNAIQTVTNDTAALLYVLVGLGISVSLILLVVSGMSHNAMLNQRSKTSLVIAVVALPLLFGLVQVANYAAGIFGG